MNYGYSKRAVYVILLSWDEQQRRSMLEEKIGSDLRIFLKGKESPRALPGELKPFYGLQMEILRVRLQTILGGLQVR